MYFSLKNLKIVLLDSSEATCLNFFETLVTLYFNSSHFIPILTIN